MYKWQRACSFIICIPLLMEICLPDALCDKKNTLIRFHSQAFVLYDVYVSR